jgi:hypothetical protein
MKDYADAPDDEVAAAAADLLVKPIPWLWGHWNPETGKVVRRYYFNFPPTDAYPARSLPRRPHHGDLLQAYREDEIVRFRECWRCPGWRTRAFRHGSK